MIQKDEEGARQQRSWIVGPTLRDVVWVLSLYHRHQKGHGLWYPMLAHTSLVDSRFFICKVNKRKPVMYGVRRAGEALSICYCELAESPLHTSNGVVFLRLCLCWMKSTTLGGWNPGGPGLSSWESQTLGTRCCRTRQKPHQH